MHRAVFSTRNTTILHSVYFTKEAYVLMAVVTVFAIDGILHLMVQNVQNQRLLKELFGFHQPKSTPIVTVILKATLARFLKVTYVWGFGLVSEMVILACIPCLVGIVIEEVPPPQE
jgi:hypothetical protein